MTHAGTITVGVDIDASAIRAELTAAIREAVLPAIAEMNRELGAGAKGYDALGRASEKSATKQVAGLNRVINKLKEARRAALEYRAAMEGTGSGPSVGTAAVDRRTRATNGLANSTRSVADAQSIYNTAIDIFGKKSPQAVQVQRALSQMQGKHTAELLRAAAQSRASTDSQVNDYQRLSREAEISAARQAAAARAADGGGGRGGGRGGGGRGSRFLSPGILNLGALGASALPAATTAVVNLAGAIQQLGGAGAILPAVFAAAGTSVGVAKIGFLGMSDAVKALNDAAGGTPEQVKKAEESLKGMAPAAVATAKAISGLVTGPLKQLKNTVQQNLNEGLGDSITSTYDKIGARVEASFGKIATAQNGAIKQLLSSVGDDKNFSLIDRMFGNTAEGTKRATAAIDPIVHAISTLVATGSDFLPRLGDAITKVAERFDAFISKAGASGDLWKWIDAGLNGLRALGNSVINFFKILGSLTKAAGGDGGFLGWLEKATGQLATFLSSTEGQEKLSKFFTEGRESLGQWMDTIKSLLPVIGEVVKGFQQWGDILLPIIKTIADALNGLSGGSGAIAAVVTAFLAFRTLGGIFGGLLGGLDKVSGALGGAGGGGVLGKLSLLKTLGGAALLGVGGNMLDDPNASGLSKLGGFASNVGGGALIGSQFGPWGIAIGALVGAGVSLFEVGRAQLEKGKAEWAAAWEANNKDPAHQQQQADKDNKILAPLLKQPSIPQSLIPKIRAGQLPGFAIGPNGEIINTATGQPVNGLPANLTTPPPAPPVGPFPVPPGRGIPPGVKPTIAPGSASELFGDKPTTWTAPPVNVDTQQLEKTKTALNEIKAQVAQGFNGQINITDPTPDIIERLRDLGVKITKLPNGKFTVDPVGLDDAVTKASNLNTQLGAFAGKTFTAKIQVSGQVTVPNAIAGPGGTTGFTPTPHRATGGVFPGYQPGVDSMWAKYSPGEGVLIPEAVRALGGGPGIYAINSAFRPGLSRRFYADGGVAPGGLPGVLTGDPVIGLLTQIRDLLAGKSGAQGPLTDIAGNTDPSAVTAAGGTSTTGTAGTHMGPFGTPIKNRNLGYDAAAAAISALGGDPEKFLGSDPATVTSVGGGAGGGNGLAAALKAFALSGSTDALAGTGLGVNDPVITALTSARAKKKGGLSDDAIAGLVDQVLTGGGFSGTLDGSNTALVKALTRFGAKGGQTTTVGSALPGAMTPLDGMAAPTEGIDTTATTAVGGVQSVFVTNWPGQPLVSPDGQAHGTGAGGAAGPGGATNFLGKPILDAAGQAAGSAASDVAGSVVSGLFGEATNFKTGTPTAPDTDLAKLIHERNGFGSAASLFGLDVPDFTRQGGEGAAGDPNAPSFDAKGRMFSDTGTLIDRSFTDLQASMKAQFDQQMAVLNQIKEQLGEKVVKPITQAGVKEGFEAVSEATFAGIGREMGETAAPIIADAVSKAVSSAQSSAQPASTGVTDGMLGIPIPKLFDEGGIMPHATTGINLSGQPERVLDPRQTRLFDAGLLGGWNAQPFQQHQATVGGVSGNATVGADFFGVSQIPLIGTIVNMLVNVLLKVLGVEIEQRDTLDEAAKDVRAFRGDFRKFDASGRLINDTSALLDRSSSSEQTAADERVRILKIVLEALVDFIINKIVIPIGKAVANAAISAAGSAAGGALNTVAPGAGGIVSALIGSGGSAGVDIFADIFSTFISALIPVVGDAVGDGLQSTFPDLMTSLFGGNLLAGLFDPVSGILSAILSPLTGGIGGGIAGIFSALLGGLAFDEGGVANGTGLMPKATIAPERVLSPNQTALFERMVTALEGGATMRGGDTHIHAPFTVTGSQQGAKQAHNRLLELMGA